MTENIKSKTNNKTSASYALLNNNTMSISQVCELLGIARSTACNAIKKNNVLFEGVPILRIGKRQLVSTYLLREALGISHPEQTKG